MNNKMIFSKIKKIILAFIMIILVTGLVNKLYATSLNLEEKNDLKSYLSDMSNVDEKQIVEVYSELSKQYSNQEIADMIEENKEQIINKSGIDKKDLDAGTVILRSLDTNETKKILEEDLDIEEIKEKLDKGYTLNQVIDEIQEKMPVSKKLSVATRLLLASSIIRTMLIVSAVIGIYPIIVRWIIFRKAGRHGWATIIPIYNQVTYLKVCGISPWWILINLIPIIGWIIYLIIQIISRFKLAYSFKRGTGFGFGLWFLAIIFESILAFNGNISYAGDEE